MLSDDHLTCIISYSKGGIDMLAFLLDVGLGVRGWVVCWVAFQAPFAGRPIADGVALVDLLRWPFEQALALFGGSVQSLHEILTDLREDYLVWHVGRIADLADTITILSVAAAVDDPPRASVHYPATIWMQRQDIRSDGIVLTWSAVLPGTLFVVIEDLAHNGAVHYHWFTEPRDRIVMTS